MLMVKSVCVNSNLKIKIKGVLTVNMLKKLTTCLDDMVTAVSFKCIVLLGFFGFFRLASLVPSAVVNFHVSRFPLVKDLVWTQTGFLKYAKNMQSCHECKVIHIPKLENLRLCPVNSTKQMITQLNLKPSDPLFMIKTSTGNTMLTDPQERRVFASVIKSLGLNPSDFGFHCLRRSGACLALELNIPLENIKLHGHWKSNAVWMYLTYIPKSAAIVATTFSTQVK